MKTVTSCKNQMLTHCFQSKATPSEGCFAGMNLTVILMKIFLKQKHKERSDTSYVYNAPEKNIRGTTFSRNQDTI